jgi:hypothetical protein
MAAFCAAGLRDAARFDLPPDLPSDATRFAAHAFADATFEDTRVLQHDVSQDNVRSRVGSVPAVPIRRSG